jgi:multifunctional beta-oxidation protein
VATSKHLSRSPPFFAALTLISVVSNPLHIDPQFARVGGFDTPILHGWAWLDNFHCSLKLIYWTGLCSFGVAGKAVLDTYGPFKELKARFSGVALPGDTLVTSLWKEGDKVYLSASIIITRLII